MPIKNELLQKYASAFIVYEIASHGVDPRETLDGTVMRIYKYEGYKSKEYEKGKRILSGCESYTEGVLDALPGLNLVDRFQKGKIIDILNKKGRNEFENALKLLYDEGKDEEAFGKIVDVIGGSFDVLGFIFFLKDDTKYLPIRSQSFDERFKLIGIDSGLSGNCVWEKYNQYITWIKEIREYLSEHINSEISLLDAHSFVWILPGIDEYINRNVQLVEHSSLGKGVITDIDDEYFTVKFASGEKKLLKKYVLDNHLLKFITPEFDIDAGAKKLSQKATEVAGALLKMIVNRERVTTYGELSDMTESKPSAYHEMPRLLDEINKHCERMGLPHISAMVVNKQTGLPGEGFRKLCIESFGYDPNLSTEEIFNSELDKIGQCDEWNKLAEYVGIDMPVEDEEILPEEIADKEQPIFEGAKKTITVNSYERDPKAKKLCKDYYMKRDGHIVCQICGFDFGAVYGIEYANKIHVHHRKPISEIGEQYEIDPIHDLIPVCPNCHLVLHSGKGITVEELEKRVKQLQSK